MTQETFMHTSCAGHQFWPATIWVKFRKREKKYKGHMSEYKISAKNRLNIKLMQKRTWGPEKETRNTVKIGSGKKMFPKYEKEQDPAPPAALENCN